MKHHVTTKHYITTKPMSGTFDTHKVVFIINEANNSIFYNRKNYSIVSRVETESGTRYKAECYRHTGKNKMLLYEATFVVVRHYVGYCETITLIENK